MFESVDSYYKFHSNIYDITRWTILFGRSSIFRQMPEFPDSEINILDIGCGTGKHLKALSEKYPFANITGLDASKEMIAKAKSKISTIKDIELKNVDLQDFLPIKNHYDLVFCSYSLSIMKDKDFYLNSIFDSLKDNGYMVVVDFNKTPYPKFEQWMNFNHVDISGLLFEELTNRFTTAFKETKNGYFGLWKYSLFVGAK